MTKFPVPTIVVKAAKTVNFISVSSNPWHTEPKKPDTNVSLDAPNGADYLCDRLEGLYAARKRTHFAALRRVRTADASLSAPMLSSGPLPGQRRPGNHVPR